MKFLVDDATRVNPKAKLTVSRISDITDFMCSDKKYIEITGAKTLRILADTIICVGDSIFKIESDVILTETALDVDSFVVGFKPLIH